MTTQPAKQAFTSLPGLPGREDPEVNALMRTLLRMTRFDAYEIVRSLFRCALAQERTGDGDYMEVLAEDALVTMRLRADPETAAALDASRSLRPAGPDRSEDVGEMLAGKDGTDDA